MHTLQFTDMVSLTSPAIKKICPTVISAAIQVLQGCVHQPQQSHSQNLREGQRNALPCSTPASTLSKRTSVLPALLTRLLLWACTEAIASGTHSVTSNTGKISDLSNASWRHVLRKDMCQAGQAIHRTATAYAQQEQGHLRSQQDQACRQPVPQGKIQQSQAMCHSIAYRPKQALHQHCKMVGATLKHRARVCQESLLSPLRSPTAIQLGLRGSVL